MSTVTVTLKSGTDIDTITAREGQNLLDVLQMHEIRIPAPCGGRGTCGKCRVSIEGEGSVLSCRYTLRHDITVDLPREARAAILHDAALKHVENDCGLQIDESGAVVSTIEGSERTVSDAASPAGLYGIAVDIGTTTVVVYLEDLAEFVAVDVASFVNPQTAHGHDVVSRIHYTMEHDAGLATLRRQVVEGINGAIGELCARNGLDTSAICKVAVVGNTTMLHLFLGVDPASIAAAPYTPAFVEQRLIDGAESGLAVHPRAVVVVLPSVSGYVGADITAGIAATDMRDTDDPVLFVDIGTNGEMALGNRTMLHCCSTAAGPAFEGATISCGTGGVDGAVSRFSSDGFETIGGAPATGICGSGILDIAAHLRAEGLVDAGGFMESDFAVASCADGAERDIAFTPGDVREVQLATAAIYAGLTILLKEAGIGMDDVARLYLAGGFGNYLRVQSAVAVGLLPASLSDRIVPIGNSAGSGCRLALRSRAFADGVNRVARAAQYIELSMRMDFNEEYVMSMSLEERG